MSASRRQFLKIIGVTAASYAVRSCKPIPPPTPTCYAPVAPTNLPTSTTPARSPDWLALRDYWLAFADREGLAGRLEQDGSLLSTGHRAVLDRLVAAGELDSAVAEDIQAAYDQALDHLIRLQATCYEPVEGGIDPYPPREDLVAQAALLDEMAAEGSLDLEAIEKVRQALSRDIAWLDDFDAGRTPSKWAQAGADDTSTRAAAILIALIVGGGG